MKEEYKAALAYTLKEAQFFRKIYKQWEKSKTGYKTPQKGAAYKNYILIVCYGQVENIFKSLLFDYFTKPSMPDRCIKFGNEIKKQLPGSLNKDRLHKFIKDECSRKWFDEIKARETKMSPCKKNKKFTYSDAYLGVESLTNARNAFAHGEHPYIGSIDDVLDYYKKSVLWLYEIDDIIKTQK